MVSPFTTTKEHIIKQINKQGLLSSNGDLIKSDAWLDLVNNLTVEVWVERKVDYGYEIVLVSEGLVKILDIESEWVRDEDHYNIFLSLESGFIINQKNVRNDFEYGLFKDASMFTHFTEENGQLHEFYSYVFPYIINEGKKYLIFHLFCKPNKMRLLQAYFIYDFYSLTTREREVMGMMVFGLDKIEISKQLGISPRTTEKHYKKILDQAKVGNQIELINTLIL